jgi:hypothetical protein
MTKISKPLTFALKKSALVLLLLTSGVICNHAVGQSIRPFHGNTIALYTTYPEQGPTSALAFSQVEFMEGDSVFTPFKSFNPEDVVGLVEPDWEGCEESFWATMGMCHKADVPLWLGLEMRSTATETYQFHTSFSEVLSFQFDLLPGDSALVYQNTEMQLYLIAEGPGGGSFLGVQESTLEFRLAHLNADAEPLNTALHDAPITLGAALGAIHFLRVDSFPQVLQPITLAGHAQSEAGLFAVKAADIYNFQEGDVLQYFFQSNFENPMLTESYYETHTVLTRTEDENEINYIFEVHRFSVDSTINEIFIEELSISKSAQISTLPFEAQNTSGTGSGIVPDGYLFQNILLTEDSCGSSYQYSSAQSWFQPCTAQGVDCFGNSFHIAPSEWYSLPSERVYKQGLGLTFSFDSWTIMGGVSGAETRELIYSAKNGFDCGNQVVLTTEEYLAVTEGMMIYPNPASSTVRLHLQSDRLIRASFQDMQGRQVLDVQLHSSEPAIDVSALPKGMYLLRVTSQNGTVYVKKLMVD